VRKSTCGLFFVRYNGDRDEQTWQENQNTP
jgi:hypothetical protein